MLVASIIKDVHPRSVLDDLRAQTIVLIDADDVVTLLARTFSPMESEGRNFYSVRNLHDHAAAAATNVLAASPHSLSAKSIMMAWAEPQLPRSKR